TRHNTAWAVVSLGCGMLACFGTVALMALPLYSSGLQQEPTGVSAGIAVFFFGFLTVMLGLLGTVCGIVALCRTRDGECGGRGMAWTGIVLGCLPFVVLVGNLIPVLWQGLWDWIGNPGREKQFPV